MTYKQEPPYAVQVELVEGCPLRCSFCGLSGIRDAKNHDYKFMELDTLASLFMQMGQANWNPRVEFASHGEPTMHPHLLDAIKLARAAAPRLQLMITSNGAGLLRKPGAAANVRALFEADLNVLALDDYEGAGYVPKIRQALAGVELPGVAVHEYPADPRGNPHQRLPVRAKRLVYVEDIGKATKGTHATLNNHAGAGAAPVDASHPTQHQRCAKPFRELTVRWDGNVAICCNDWRGVYKCGNAVTDGLLRVWNGAAMDAARQKLYHGQRDFGPCRGCNAVSYRVGLLPDKYGKVDLPRPNAKTEAVIKAALSGAPYTAPVRRPWENQR